MCVCVYKHHLNLEPKLGLKNVARFACNEWNKFFNGLAKETKHTILELDGM